MANKDLKSLTFPGLPDTYVIPEIELDDTLTQEGEAADAKAVGEALATKVAKTTTINEKPLSANVVLGSGDIGYDDAETYPSGSVGAEVNQLKSAVIDLEDAVNDSTTGLNTKAPVIISNASGAIASFADGADGMPMKVVANIEPVQDLHGQDSPYPPGGRGNLFQTTGTSKTQSGITWTVNADGSVTVSGTATGYTDFTVGEAIVDGITGNVTISGNVSSGNNIVFGFINLYDANDSLLATVYNGGSQTAHVVDLSQYPTAKYIRVNLKRNNNVATSGTYKIQVEKGSTATEWHPFSNICPISGHTECNVTRTGKNLWGFTADDFSNHVLYGQAKFITVHLPAGTYTISTNAPTGYIWAGLNIPQNSARVYEGSPETITLSSGDVLCLGVSRDNTGTALAYNNQLELGSEATTFEPFGTTIPITFPTEAGTVYGGNLTINRDGSVDLVKYYHRIEVTECTLVSVASSGVNYARISLVDYAVQENVSNKGWSSEYKFVSGVPTEGGRFRAFQSNVFIYDTRFTDKTVADGILASEKPQFVYKLATPVTYHLDSIDQITTLLGINNVWADTGDVVVDYPADTKLYIDGLTAPDEDMIADSNIDSGKYFVVGNNLYLSTAAILAGEQIIPGSNCTLTNLAEALNLINT